jgi:hypothetical protein
MGVNENNRRVGGCNRYNWQALYKFYRYLKACPAVQPIDSTCTDPDIGADAWGMTCEQKKTYDWLCDYNGAHSCQCCACNKDTCGTADGSNTKAQ